MSSRFAVILYKICHVHGFLIFLWISYVRMGEDKNKEKDDKCQGISFKLEILLKEMKDNSRFVFKNL